jgi:O-antigen ligase
VSRAFSIGSLSLAGVTLLLTRSPLAVGALIIVAIAAAALYGLRRAEPEARRFWQLGLLVASVLAGSLAWASRSAIVTAFNASGELKYRLDVWHNVSDLIALHPLQGWGWIGTWRSDIAPFQVFEQLGARSSTSASNVFFDVWLQLGLIGLVLFLGLLGLAFARSWLLASRQRSVVFAWPALILVALVATALAESSLLVEFGWLTFVVCTLKAAQQLSWRTALTDEEPAASGE